MLRAVWVLSLLLTFCLENGAALAMAAKDPVPDSAEGGITPTPLEVDSALSSGKDAPVAPTKIIPSVSEAAALAQASSAILAVPPPFSPTAPGAKTEVSATPVVIAAPLSPAPVSSTPSAITSAVVSPVSIAPTTESSPKASDQKIVDVPLPDIDPETMGLFSASSGGLGDSLWQDTSRSFVDRLMTSIALPTPSATLNDTARRMFLTTAAVPKLVAGDAAPAHSLMAERIAALLALGAVPEAWKLANLAGPGLVDSVTLRGLAEASLIGPESKEICDKIPSLMEAHGKTEESATEWQKSLLICQLRANDTKAVQVGVDLMREQGATDAVFLSLISRNVIGDSKQLPRRLTPLNPTNLAVLRQLEIPLPPELYARPDAALIPELLQTRASDEKMRLLLAERTGAKGLLTPGQLADVYKSIIVTPQDMTGGNLPTDISPRSRAVIFQAALNEQNAQKKIDLVQMFITGVEPSALTGTQIKLAASLLENVPITSDSNVSSVGVARIFAMAGRPDKTLAWLKLARDAASRSPDIAGQLTDAWPLFVLLGIIPDGEYAQGMKAWMSRSLATTGDGKEMQNKREQTGKILLLLNAAGYAVPDEGWQQVIDVVPSSKQMTASPLIQERLRSASREGRKGETVLLSLLIAGGPQTEPSLGAMTDIVRALRLVGLTAEAQSLAREVVVGVGGG